MLEKETGFEDPVGKVGGGGWGKSGGRQEDFGL